jgi:glycosyltransferase involved in cell wall biosynthesis
MRITAFFPVYNDGASIPVLVLKTIKVMELAGADYEIILVDDGSTDGTKEVVDKLSDDYPKVRAVHHDVNRGYGAALRSGFENARMDWVFYTDGDGQYDVGELAELMKHASNGYDAVVGRKISRSDPLYRKVLGGAYAAFVKSMFGLKTVMWTATSGSSGAACSRNSS